jgi:hypothetical protein
MRLAAARRAEQQQVAALFQPTVAGGECHDAGAADHRDRREVEAVQGLAGRQVRLGQVAFDATPSTLGGLKFGERREEPCRRPALAIGTLGHLLPEPSDGGQAQFGQQQRQTGGVDLDGGHALTHSAAWVNKAS